MWSSIRRVGYVSFVRTASLLICLLVAACGQSNKNPDGGVGGGSGGGGAGGGGTGGGGAADSGWIEAAHPVMPQLVSADGGPVLSTPNARFIFYPGHPFEPDLETYAQHMTTSTYWATTTSEYGVGPLTYAGKIELTGQTPPTTISSTDLHTQMQSWLQLGTLGTVDPEGIYTIVFPVSTKITRPNPVSSLFGTIDSCTGFGGYHDHVELPLGDGGTQLVAFAVIPTCGTTPDVNGLTEVISHEWIEAATDPFLDSNGGLNLTGGPYAAYFNVDQDHVIWGVMGGGEAGDLCEFGGPKIDVSLADVGFVTQRTWSNKAAAAGHDPCVPEIAGPYFAAAPVLTDDVTLTSGITGTIHSKGIVIPVGGSKTIDVQLFSDGDTGHPWTVIAEDLMYRFYGPYGFNKTLDLTWDKTEGKNGDVLHLTIKVTAQSAIGGGHAILITSTDGDRVALWPGLIVEH